MTESRDFHTQRLHVFEWQSGSEHGWKDLRLVPFIQTLLTTRVTEPLPPDWHGAYPPMRAASWILDRDKESTNFVAVDKITGLPIGLVLLATTTDRELRLGYLLTESSWGKGFATELVRGFVAWSGLLDVDRLIAGVGKANVASRRVLEKCGFELDNSLCTDDEDMFVFSR